MGILESLKALIASEEAPAFDLAEGQVSKIEVGRPGKFRAKVGGVVELTPEKLANIAATFDPDGYHKLKLGHKEIDTDTPDMGDVVGLEWDATRERLLAAVRPTESLVEKNRKGEFRRISMELGKGADLPLRHISFLGAHRPAISGLAPVHLAAENPGEIFLAADGDEEILILSEEAVELADFTAAERKKLAKEGIAMPDGSYPIRNKSDLANAIQAFGRASNPDAVKAHIKKRAAALGATEMLPDSWKSGKKMAEAIQTPAEVSSDDGFASSSHTINERSEASTKETKMAEDAVALAEEKERSARLAARIVRAAGERVDAFLERHKDKIPMALHKKGIKEVLTYLAAKEGDEGDSVMLALPGEAQPSERSQYALVSGLLAELPPLVAEVEKTEVAVKGADTPTETSTLPPVLASMHPDPEGDAYLLAAIEEQNAARAKGETIDFAEAARRIYAKRGDRG